jgi:hypothetical protein
VNFMNTDTLSICDDLARIPDMQLEDIAFVVEELDGDRGDDFMRRFTSTWDGLLMVKQRVHSDGRPVRMFRRPKKLRLAVKRRKDLGLSPRYSAAC